MLLLLRILIWLKYSWNLLMCGVGECWHHMLPYWFLLSSSLSVLLLMYNLQIACLLKLPMVKHQIKRTNNNNFCAPSPTQFDLCAIGVGGCWHHMLPYWFLLSSSLSVLLLLYNPQIAWSHTCNHAAEW